MLRHGSVDPLLMSVFMAKKEVSRSIWCYLCPVAIFKTLGGGGEAIIRTRRLFKIIQGNTVVNYSNCKGCSFSPIPVVLAFLINEDKMVETKTKLKTITKSLWNLELQCLYDLANKFADVLCFAVNMINTAWILCSSSCCNAARCPSLRAIELISITVNTKIRESKVPFTKTCYCACAQPRVKKGKMTVKIWIFSEIFSKMYKH